MRKTLLSAMSSLLLLHPASAAEELRMNEDYWDISEADSVEFKQVRGRDAICFEGGGVLVKDRWLDEGILSVDIENTHHRHFGYLSFLAVDTKNTEEVYLRMHKSRQLDAVQYEPHMNSEPNWQLMGHAQASADFGQGDWVNLQVEFDNKRALATVKSSAGETDMQINELLLMQDGKRFGLRALFPTCFSNFQVIERQPNLSDIPSPIHRDSPGIIRNWKLSPQSRFEQFPDRVSIQTDWIEAKANPSGTLMVSRYVKKQSSGNFGRNEMDLVFAGTEIHADVKRNIVMSFDVSDIGRVYLNGSPVVQINNSFRAKGTALFRGDFSPSTQKVFLDLRPGKNELVVAVAERTNGWGLAAELESVEGLTIR